MELHVQILGAINSTVNALQDILDQHVKSSTPAITTSALMELHVRPPEAALFVFVLNFILELIVRRTQTPVHKVHVKMVESVRSLALVKHINVSASKATQEPTVRPSTTALTIRVRMEAPVLRVVLHIPVSV